MGSKKEKIDRTGQKTKKRRKEPLGTSLYKVISMVVIVSLALYIAWDQFIEKDIPVNLTTVSAVNGLVPSGSSVSVVAGLNQSTIIGSDFKKALSLKITTSEGNPVSNASVTFVAGNINVPKNVTSSAQMSRVYNSTPPIQLAISGAGGTSIENPGTFGKCAANPTQQECATYSDQTGEATSSYLTASSTPGRFNVVATVSTDTGKSISVVFHMINLLQSGGLPPVIKLPNGDFGITGNISEPYYPGAQYPIDLIIYNPFAYPIHISPGNIDISVSTSSPACNAQENYGTIQGLMEGITIPSKSSMSLSDLSVPKDSWPIVVMYNTNMNQDSCRGGRVEFAYTGKASRSRN